MTHIYTEDQLIEQTCIDIFKNQLQWEIANVYQGETFGADGTLGRESEADILLKGRFLSAIQLQYALNQSIHSLVFLFLCLFPFHFPVFRSPAIRKR